MVDAADQDKMEAVRNELHNLLDKPQLVRIPVLVLGNKRDIPGALDEKQLIERLWVHTSVSVSSVLVLSLAVNAVFIWFPVPIFWGYAWKNTS